MISLHSCIAPPGMLAVQAKVQRLGECGCLYFFDRRIFHATSPLYVRKSFLQTSLSTGNWQDKMHATSINSFSSSDFCSLTLSHPLPGHFGLGQRLSCCKSTTFGSISKGKVMMVVAVLCYSQGQFSALHTESNFIKLHKHLSCWGCSIDAVLPCKISHSRYKGWPNLPGHGPAGGRSQGHSGLPRCPHLASHRRQEPWSPWSSPALCRCGENHEMSHVAHMRRFKLPQAYRFKSNDRDLQCGHFVGMC